MKKKPIQHKSIKNSTRHKDKAVGSGNEMKIIGNIWKINFFLRFLVYVNANCEYAPVEILQYRLSHFIELWHSLSPCSILFHTHDI